MAAIHIEPQLTAPIFVCLALLLQYTVISFVVPSRARRRHFPMHWLKTNFGDQHRNAFGCQIPSQGYPDVGDGRYSSALSYKDWVQFNVAIRTQGNFLEQLCPIVFCTMVAGLAWWIPATIIGGIYFIGRIVYTIGYTSKSGARGRAVGALMTIPVLILQMTLAFIGCFKIAGVIPD